MVVNAFRTTKLDDTVTDSFCVTLYKPRLVIAVRLWSNGRSRRWARCSVRWSLLLQPLPLQLMMLIISMDRMDPESRPTAGETAAASCCF